MKKIKKIKKNKPPPPQNHDFEQVDTKANVAPKKRIETADLRIKQNGNEQCKENKCTFY